MSSKITFKTTSGEDGSIACDGATPSDRSPAGAVLRLIMAILRKDEPAMRQELVAMPEGGPPPGPPSTHATVKVKETTYETPDKALVPTESVAADQPQDMTFIVVRQGDAWKVDINESIERMMGAMMNVMREGMEAVGQAMGEAMTQAMKGIGEALEGKSMGEIPSDEDRAQDEPTKAPPKSNPKRKRKR
jgi:hypothetical protein